MNSKIPNCSNTVDATYSLKFKSHNTTQNDPKDLNTIIIQATEATEAALSKTQINTSDSTNTNIAAPSVITATHNHPQQNKVAPLPLACPPMIHIGGSTGTMRPLNDDDVGEGQSSFNHFVVNSNENGDENDVGNATTNQRL